MYRSIENNDMKRLIYVYTECHCAECRYAEYRYAKDHGTVSS